MHGLTQTALFGPVGFVFGLLHLLVLRANVRLYLGRARIWQPAAMHLARMLAVAVLFVVVAQAGGWALVGTLAGFLIARQVAFRAWTGQA